MTSGGKDVDHNALRLNKTKAMCKFLFLFLHAHWMTRSETTASSIYCISGVVTSLTSLLMLGAL